MSKHPLLAKFAGYSCVLLFALFVVGCGGGYQAPPPLQPLTISITPATAAMATGQSMPFAATGDPSGVTWSVSSASATPGTIDASGNYTAPAGAQSLTASIKATSMTNPVYSSSVSVNVVAPGTFAPTNNVQVAQYTVSPAAAANVSVQFGLDTSYGLTTWTQPAPATGGSVSLFVAGMKQSTLYHMRGVVAFADGSSFNDADQTFTTGAVPKTLRPSLTATTTSGMTPQSGVELLSLVIVNSPGFLPESVVTDLAGNVLWVYQPTTLPGDPAPNPIKLLPNGHFLISLSGQPDGFNFVIQEVDLGSNVIWQMTTAQLNAALAAATCSGCHITVTGAHHDFAILPNGHIILIAATTEVVAGVTVTGDVLIDLDQNHNPVWLWNEFTHLDITRQPYMYPDWTHTNAVLYSASDGNLIISMRHQNWLLKIDYNNGAGAGDILWHLGYQGDFALLNADGSTDTNATDWFFAQHGPSFVGTNTSGKFSIVLFDNGDDRGVADVAGGTCGTGQPVACYSTVPLFNIDETAMTATLAFNPTTPDYSWFGGNTEILANGNVEFDECGATLLPTNSSKILEVTQVPTPVTVWQMNIAGQYAYRGFRMPSLYPGVQW